jgi:parvulin-like peptidyl-prolyl isomerase
MSIREIGQGAVSPWIYKLSRKSKRFREILVSVFKKTSPIRVRHILVKTREEAEEVLQRLRRGEDFSKLAQERSICPSGRRGGDLGYFGPGVMVKPFEDAAYSLLREGDISGVVKTQFGYHIIRLEDRITLPFILRKRWMLFPAFRERFLDALNKAYR